MENKLVSGGDAECDANAHLLAIRWWIRDPLRDDTDCVMKNGFYRDEVLLTGHYVEIECDEQNADSFSLSFYRDFN